jgi:hypothetical protein
MGISARWAPFAFFAAVVLLTALILLASVAALAPPAGARAAAPGTFVWERVPYRTRDMSNSLYLLSKGPSGTVYAAGVRGEADASQTWVVKYLADGRRAWAKTWGISGGDSSDRNEAGALAVDRYGNAYVVASHRVGLDWGTTVLKYDAKAHLLWASSGPATSYGHSGPTCAVGIDAAGTVYVTGAGDGAGDRDVFLARYRPSDGERTSLNWYDHAGYDQSVDLAVTPSGDCYTCGITFASGQPSDALLIKWVDGAQSWAKAWHPAVDASEEWGRVRVSAAGDAYVAGYADDGTPDLAAARYDTTGALVWDATWSSGVAYGDTFEDAALAGDGSWWIAGYTHTARIGKTRGELVRWTAAGTRAFARVVGTSSKPVVFSAVTADASGNAYVVGRQKAVSAGTDPLAVKYGRRGGVLWRSARALAGSGNDGLTNVVLGGPGFLYASGVVGEVGFGADLGLLVRIRR